MSLRITRRFTSSTSGAAAIELALLLPVFLLFTLGVIEFGYYFVKAEIANSAISTVSQTIQRDPGYYASLTPAQLKKVEQSYGSGLIDFTATGNYLCVDAYTTPIQAANAPACTSTYFNTANPNGPNSTIPYYIAVRVDLPKGGLTPLVNFVPAVRKMRIAQSSGAVEVGNLIPPNCTGPGWVLQYNSTTKQFLCVNINPPVCDQTNYFLQFNGTNYVCAPVGNKLPNNCSQPWQKMIFNNGQYGCQNIPYIIAGGTTRPGAQNGVPVGNSYWNNDQTIVSWIPASNNHNRITLCENSGPFTIPAGLPAGQILPVGTLTYPGVQGAWHSWSISFVNINFPAGGGQGSMDICESNTGNWIMDDYPITVGAETVAWNILFIPSSR